MVINMVLVVGGRYAGKREFVQSHYGCAENDIARALLDDSPAVSHVQDMVGRMDAELLYNELIKKRVVICDEVGCGVVPADPAQRQWREAVGRLCCALSEQAETVIRVYYGIPIPLKGSL